MVKNLAPGSRRFKRRKAKKVNKSVKTYVKNEFDKLTEDKQAGLSQTATTVGNTGDFYLCNGIGQGTDQGQRVANRIKLKYIVIRMPLAQSGGAITRQRLRVMLFYDKQANGAIPSITQLLTNTTAGDTHFSPINLDGAKRYKILVDELMDFQVHGGATDVGESKTYVKAMKLNSTVVYNGTGTGIADINTNSLYLALFGSQNAGLTTSIQVDLRYEDA